jgi:soluble lytic murein transglycosylase-like protein
MPSMVSEANSFAPRVGAAPYPTFASTAPFAAPQRNFGQTKDRRSSALGATSGMAAAQASAAGVPVSLVERVIARESGGNPRAVHAGNYGLMQIRLGTARAMGYTGSAAGLLDPQTNMTYAVRYLAGAYRAAGGDENRAIALYARGYYYQAKAQGFSPYAQGGSSYGFGTGASASLFTPAGFFQSSAPAGAGYRVRHHRRHAV